MVGSRTDAVALADFSNTVVVMTSNIGGAAHPRDRRRSIFASAEGRDALRDDVFSDELRKFLRPEFLNRIDDVIIFQPLSQGENLRGIVDIQLQAGSRSSSKGAS